MESAVLSTPTTSRFRTHENPAGAGILWTSTLPKQRQRSEAGHTLHHTLPRAAAQHKWPPVCRLEPLSPHRTTSRGQPDPHTVHYDIIDVDMTAKPNGVVKLKGTLAREVANAWGSRVGRPDQPAPKDRILSLFNDIELYPTEDQVSEMLVCARQCARRKSFTLTFSEFCVFAAELRRCSRQARQTQSKPGSPQRSTEKEAAPRKPINGSEAPSPPQWEVFLGGSCNPTTWRSDIAIPMLKKMGITYFNPQVEEWSSDLLEVEHRAKAAARAFLFVLDSETRAVATAVEAAHLAAAPRDLLVVLRPYSRQQLIGRETITDHEYVELSRARATLQEAVERRGLPAFKDIPAALGCARAVLRGARTHARLFGHTILRLKRAFDAAGGRVAKLPRGKAIDALRDITRAPRETAERTLPSAAETVDFDTFCAAVAELSADGAGVGGGGVAARLRRALQSLRDRLSSHADCPRNGVEVTEGCAEGSAGRDAAADSTTSRDVTTLHSYNARLKACGRKLGLFIPKNGGNRTECEGLASGDSSADSVFTPGTERRLERLPALLAAPTYDVYLGGSFPISRTRPEELLRREGFTYVVPRAVDYARMFSAPGRRSAPAHPESPRTDKKPRPAAPAPATDEADVLYRERASPPEPADRRSAPDFQSVVDDAAPTSNRAAYDEEQLSSSRVLVFAIGGESPNFATMVLAAHYLGLRPADTVLLLQFMDPTQTQLYSEAAVKDYNRGRHYVADFARRAGVPVFDNTEDTINCVVARLRATAVPNSST